MLNSHIGHGVRNGGAAWVPGAHLQASQGYGTGLRSPGVRQEGEDVSSTWKLFSNDVAARMAKRRLEQRG